MKSLPKISIITPSFNQGKFIEETILSVIGQGYPNLEYIIIDGGSDDETVEIIRKYDNQISYWTSEPDNGQGHAINKGFARATGDIIGWLNSDDMYLPKTLFHVAEAFGYSGDATKIIFGNCIHFRESPTELSSWGSNVVKASENYILEEIDFIIQPSSFWTKKTWDFLGPLREDIHYVFDWEWFLRAKTKGVLLQAISKCLSMYRIHEEHKSGSGGKKRQKEILGIYQNYSKKYFSLYQLLTNESDLNNQNIRSKFVRNTLRILNKPYNDIDVLKLSNYIKYKAYTTQDITNCRAML